MRALALASVALAVVAACSGAQPSGTTAEALPTGDLHLEEVATGLQNPLYVTAPPADARVFVVEQGGRIVIVHAGRVLPTPDRNGDTRVERYRVSADPNIADPTSGLLVLSVPQPFANHNGGMVLFGGDGMLYIGMGDGGSGGDPQGNGQNKGSLLGKLLRLDVDRADPGRAYAIPRDNPFVGENGSRGEIWAYGLRNPWRFAFDREAGLLFTADVGQNAWEEVDVVPSARPGVNYGWNVMEGRHCYRADCAVTAGLEKPVLEYDHSNGCSITGGFVYRGRAMPALRGAYFYSDYCSGWLRSFRMTHGRVTDRREWNVGSLGAVLSFGEDARGELYICSANGTVYRLAPGSRAPASHR